jgi:small subunit ribosomal protein S1
MREAVAATAEVTVMVLSIDGDKRRVALALAPEDATAGDQVESRVAVGAVLTGTVERVESFGVFVRLGPGQTGLIPSAELETTRETDHRRAFPLGSEIKVLVLAIEEGGRRIRLSHTQARAQEEKAEAQAYVRDATKKGDGFGLTLGEKFRQARGEQ